MTAKTVEAIRQALTAAEHILVITHVSPDGDALGSLTAMGLMLQALGKSFTLACDDGLLPRFRYLPLAGEVQTGTSPGAVYDLIVALDAADESRMGRSYRDLATPRPPIINIDHHVTNTRFGQMNLIAGTAPATTEILFDLLEPLDIPLNRDLAVCLLTGLVTDTLNFRTSSVTGRTLQVAGRLVAAGARLYEITTQALSLKSMTTLLLWQKGLSNMELLEEGLLWTSISKEERRAINHQSSSTDGLGNLLSDTYQSVMSAILLEMEDGQIIASMRCRPPYRVDEVASHFGGGGHKLAAGCSLSGPLAAAEKALISRCRKAIRLVTADQKAEQEIG